MITVDIAVAPFPVTNDCYTRIIVDGHPDWFSSKENRFYSYVIKKPIRTWISPYRKRIFVWPGFLPAFVKEANEASYFFRFSGLREDFDLFKEEINFQAAHLLEERVSVDVNSDVILNLDRMADELQVILSEIIDNSIISKRNRKLAQYIRQQLKKEELEFELNEKKIAPGLLLCTAHPILSEKASELLSPMISDAYALFIQPDDGQGTLENVMAFMNTFDSTQINSTYVFCASEDGEFGLEILLEQLHRENLLVSGVRTCDGGGQGKYFIQDELFKSIFHKQYILGAVDVIAESVGNCTASTDAMSMFAAFRNNLFSERTQ